MPPETADESVDLELALRALSAYDLPEPVVVRLHASGLNTAFHVTSDGRRYALRLHRSGYRTTAQISSELRFVRYVAEQWADEPLLAVPRPILDRNGELVVTTGNQAVRCDLTTWVDGDVLAPGQGLTAGMFVTSPYRPGLAIEELLDQRDLDLYQEFADRTRTIFAALGADARGIIHGDYILGNCHLQRAGSDWQVAVFDFDDCGSGYFLYDLCPLLGNLAGHPGAVPDNPDYPMLRDAFLAGYRTTRPLPADLEQPLPAHRAL